MLKCLSFLFGTRLVVPEYCIDKLGQDHVNPQCDFFSFRWGKNHFWTKPITKNLVTSLEYLYCQECPNESESYALSTIDIVEDLTERI